MPHVYVYMHYMCIHYIYIYIYIPRPVAAVEHVLLGRVADGRAGKGGI